MSKFDNIDMTSDKLLEERMRDMIEKIKDKYIDSNEYSLEQKQQWEKVIVKLEQKAFKTRPLSSNVLNIKENDISKMPSLSSWFNLSSKNIYPNLSKIYAINTYKIKAR